MIESLPANLTNILYDALGQIKNIVVMKKAGTVPANLAKNIHLLELIPQNDLLGHKNVKLFMTNCGLNSVVEAVYHGVPIVGLPLAYDQPFNAFVLNLKGYGKQLKWGDFKAKDLKEAIKELLGSPVFGEKRNICPCPSVIKWTPQLRESLSGLITCYNMGMGNSARKLLI